MLSSMRSPTPRILAALFAAPLLCAVGCAQDRDAYETAATPAREGLPAPAFPEPLWLTRKISHGLAQSGGAVVAGSKRMPLEPPPPDLFAAAYYAAPGLLTAVSGDGTVLLYRERDGRLVEQTRRTPSRPARMGRMWFTRVPGLVYVTRIDLADEKTLETSRAVQMGSGYDERVALLPSAEPWDAIPADQREEVLLEKLLQGVYRAEPDAFLLSMAPSRWLRVSLPRPLDPPLQLSRAGFPLEAVFPFGDRGLLCKTNGGWSLHRVDGALVGWFSTEGIKADWWEAPTFAEGPSPPEGAFYVHARTGPSGASYRLDMKEQRLVLAQGRALADRP
jgi:hypothetical protein